MVNFNNFDLIVNLVATVYTVIEFFNRKRQDKMLAAFELDKYVD